MSTIAEQIISPQNIGNLCSICERFFLEKYKLNVSQDTLNKTIPILLNKLITHYTKNPPLPNVQEINKIAMQQMKDFILSKINKQDQVLQAQQTPLLAQQHIEPLQQLQPTQHPQQPQQPQQLPSTQSTNFKNINVANLKYNPNDLYTNEQPPQLNEEKNLNLVDRERERERDRERDIDKEKAANTPADNEFFMKLQDLENFRKNASIVKTENAAAFLNQQNIPNVPEKIQQPIIIQQVASSTPVTRITKSIIINASTSRDWIYFHERTMFIWPGLPINSETYSSTILLKQLLLPRRVAKNTPVVILEITGSSSKSVDLVCILNNPGVNWDSWKCVNDGAIQNMSYPWTIKILDENKKTLNNLGKDGSIITNASILYNGNTQINVEPFMNCIEIGTQLKIYKSIKDNFIFNVVNITGKNIEIEGNATEMVEGIVCNLGYQPYIILDI